MKDFFADVMPFICLTGLIVSLFVGIVSIVTFNVKDMEHQKGYMIETTISSESISVHEISVRGERHEYLFRDRSFVHLPNCRFCKSDVEAKQ